MNREMELAHLAIADKAVASGERHILLQERRVAELDRDGHDTKQALATLAIFRRLQVEHVAHRDLILKVLQQGEAKLRASSEPVFPSAKDDDAGKQQEQDGRPKDRSI